MNRRGFLKFVAAIPAVGVIPWAFSAPTRLQMPLIRYTSIPPGKKDKNDPLGQRGYFGGTIEIHGKKYSCLYEYTERSWKELGQAEIDRQMRAMVDTRMRVIFEEVS